MAPYPTRKSIFPVPLMSFYGEQRRKLQEAEEALQMEWAKYFNEVIVTKGEELCVKGYEGYLRTGSKGAVTIYCDGEQGLNACTALKFNTLEELLADDRMEEAIKEQLVVRFLFVWIACVGGLVGRWWFVWAAGGWSGYASISLPCFSLIRHPIISHPFFLPPNSPPPPTPPPQTQERVTSYDPDFEVAVLFAYEGQVGLNVLRPQYPPKFMFEMMRGKK